MANPIDNLIFYSHKMMQISIGDMVLHIKIIKFDSFTLVIQFSTTLEYDRYSFSAANLKILDNDGSTHLDMEIDEEYSFILSRGIVDFYVSKGLLDQIAEDMSTEFDTLLEGRYNLVNEFSCYYNNKYLKN